MWFSCGNAGLYTFGINGTSRGSLDDSGLRILDNLGNPIISALTSSFTAATTIFYNTLSQLSDKKYKNNIKSIDNGLEIINKLNSNDNNI